MFPPVIVYIPVPQVLQTCKPSLNLVYPILLNLFQEITNYELNSWTEDGCIDTDTDWNNLRSNVLKAITDIARVIPIVQACYPIGESNYMLLPDD